MTPTERELRIVQAVASFQQRQRRRPAKVKQTDRQRHLLAREQGETEP